MKKRKNRLSRVAAATACAVVFLLSEVPCPVLASQLLPGHVLKETANLHAIRHFETNHLRLAIGLPLRNKQDLTNLLQQIYDPTSTNYHHYLSPTEFAARFGPTEADYQNLRKFALSNHLAVVGSHPNRMVLDVQGSVGDVEKAFHTTLQVYRHPKESREFYAPTAEPSINSAVPVLHVSGLDNYQLPHPMSLKQTPLPHAGGVGTGSGPGGTYLGYDFRAAYIPGVTLTGTGQTVGLLEFDSGFEQSDITAYEGLAGLPNISVVPILLDGYNGSLGNAPDEVSLDIEMAISMAPGLNSVLVYEADVTDDVLNRMATDDLAKQIGASWTYPIDPTSEQIFQQFGVQGQSFYNAAGDSDAYVGVIPTPADDPNITVVGGTTLTTSGPRGNWVSEKVWNWGGGEGGSGGISTVYPIPTWQQGISMVANHGSTTFRNLPDVALTADNIWVIYAGGQQGDFGGTSCATPLWAAFTALVNQQAAANGETNQGFINPAIYAIGKGLDSTYVTSIHDIVLGDDTWTNSPDNFFAVPGYDLATGWGTPYGSNLINILAPISTTPVFAVVTNIISGGNGNGIIDFDECNNLTIVLTNQGSVIATGVQATLSSSTLGAIVAQSSSAYPDIFSHSSAANLNNFTLSTEPNFVCGTPINLTLIVKCDEIVQTNYITLPSGVLGSPDVFSSTTALPIPNNTFVPVNSPIVVSGLQAVGKLTVSVYIPALFDDGLSLSLIGPSGTNVLLSANNGAGSGFGVGCGPGYETTFDDAASVSILNGVPPFVGSFQPQQPLSVFKLANGTNLNGTWYLQVSDEFPGDTAELACWSLNISPEVCVDGGGQCPGADLSLAMTASPNPVFVNSNIVYYLTVSNAGPGTADNVIIAQNLPAGMIFETTSNYPVNVSQSGSNTVNLALGSLPVYATATVAVIATPTIPGETTTTANVGSQDTDPNPANNSASVTFLVTEPTADVAVTMSATPAAVLEGEPITYTINVTNNGPFTADAVTLAIALPANANFISATASQGTISGNGTYAQLGNISVGASAVVTIVISPTITGNVTATATATISSTEVDPITFNNTASVTTTVGPAADLGVTGFATPSPVIAGNNFSYILTVSNAGPSAATGVGYSQTVPSGCTFVSSSLGTLSGTVVNGTVGAMNAATGIIITNVFTSPTLLAGVKSTSFSSTVQVSGQPGDPNLLNNSLTITTIAEPPVVTLISAGANVISGSGNGSVGTNGTYTVQLFVENTGTISTVNLQGTLQNSSSLTVFSGGTASYGAIAPGATGAGQFTFATTSTNGGSIQAVLALQDPATLGTNIIYVTNTFVMPVVKTFWNTNYISIPTQADQPQPDEGPANPYPSPIVVSGVSGDVSSVTVTVSNLFHTYPHDIGMLLVGPTGANCVLMSAVADYTTMYAPATVTFNQNATSVLANQEENIVTASYQPADYYTSQYGITETYPNASEPVGPYNTNLTVFNSAAPNGTWSLYVYDFAEGDAGWISNGWSLSFATITPVNQIADLAANLTVSSNQVPLGGLVTNIWTITNYGPDAALAYVTNVLPAGLTFVTNLFASNTISSFNGTTNVCNLGTIQPGGVAAVTNIAQGSVSGLQTNIITVGSPVLDGNLVNNTASVIIGVIPPPVSLVLAPISVTPNPVVVNNNTVYTLWVTNNGPSNAFNVVGILSNSAALHVTGVILSQGSYVTNASNVQFNLGTISNGSAAEIILTNTVPAVAGTLTNTWTVTTTSSNLNYNNNSVGALVTVTFPIPIIVAGGATLVSQASAPFNGAINSGQTNTVSLTLSNIGAGPTSNLVATLVASANITPITHSNSYGAIPVGGAVSEPFTFAGTGKAGATITAELTLKDGSNSSLGPVYYNFVIPSTGTFANTGEIIIPFEGPANPYPSTIVVSGLNNGTTNLLTSKVTATLNGFAHTWPHDVEAILVSPTGQELALMEHTGAFYSVTNLTLTFEDAATADLPLSNSLTSGNFLATEYAPFDTFPGLGAVPTNSPGLSIFNGMNPNGTWSLYVYDDTPGNDGVITGGWSLGLTAVSTVNPAALLNLSTLESPSPAIEGNYVNYEITVNNSGPTNATGVVLTDVIPTGSTYSSTYISPSGNFSVSGQTVTCNLGTISNGASAVVTIQVLAGNGTSLVNTATVTAATADLYAAGSTNVTVTPEVGSLAALTATPFGNGVLQLKVTGYPGQVYAIQSSTNLHTWTTISTNDGSSAFVDTTTNGPSRFYRTIQLPQ